MSHWDDKPFGRRLRDERIRHLLNQGDAAELTGMTVARWSAIEARGERPEPGEIEAIAAQFGFEPWELYRLVEIQEGVL